MMATLAFCVSLGPYDTGLTLAAQLLDTDGDPSGSAITTGWIEIGDGHYGLVTEITTGFRGFITVYDTANPTFILEAGAINPEEIVT